MAGRFVLQGFTELPAHLLDVTQLQIAVPLARRTDADHGELRLLHGHVELGHAFDESGRHTLLQQTFKAGFDDGRLTAVDQVNLRLGDIHTVNGVTPLCQTSRTYRSDVAKTNDTDTHSLNLPIY